MASFSTSVIIISGSIISSNLRWRVHDNSHWTRDCTTHCLPICFVRTFCCFYSVKRAVIKWQSTHACTGQQTHTQLCILYSGRCELPSFGLFIAMDLLIISSFDTKHRTNTIAVNVSLYNIFLVTSKSNITPFTVCLPIPCLITAQQHLFEYEKSVQLTVLVTVWKGITF